MNDEMIICEDCTARIRESEIQASIDLALRSLKQKPDLHTPIIMNYNLLLIKDLADLLRNEGGKAYIGEPTPISASAHDRECT